MSATTRESDMAMRDSQQGQSTALLTAYNPMDFHGSLAIPDDMASTFQFPTAEIGRFRFALAYGLHDVEEEMRAWFRERGQDPDEIERWIYARLSGPVLEVVERMMVALEPGADWAYIMPSGMSTIELMARATCAPGSERDTFIHSRLLYGGTHALTHAILPRDGFNVVEVDTRDPSKLKAALEEWGDRVGCVFCETPANPHLEMSDIMALARVIEKYYEKRRPENRPPLVVDNTFMGRFQNPLRLGADVVIYSTTKFLGGHGDLIGGMIVGRSGLKVDGMDLTGKKAVFPLEKYIGLRRTICGFTTSSSVAQRLATHMHTYLLRMEREQANAREVAAFLREQKKIKRVFYPEFFEGRDRETWERQCSKQPGAMIAFTFEDDTMAAAFRFLNALRVCVLAVSLGATRTLVENPSSMTHSDIPLDLQAELGITPSMCRLAIGLEDPADIIADLEQALEKV